MIVTELGGDEGFVLVRGRVEETLPRAAPPLLALLRLDTDFYGSTKIELETLYPRLVSGGVITIDEFMAAQPLRPLLQRIDGSVWAGVKP